MYVLALRRVSTLSVVALAAIALLGLSSGDTNAQWVPGTPQFQPTFDAKLCNDLSPTFSGPNELKGGGGTCTPNTAPGGHPDTTTTFTVPLGHMAYDQSYFVVAGGANETRLDGAAIGGPNPDGTGAAAGGLQSQVTLGLAANPCNNTLFPDLPEPGKIRRLAYDRCPVKFKVAGIDNRTLRGMQYRHDRIND